ncbi:MAG TPA: DUF4434 domain-containing protein [Bacteroidales bacterium]|nr:DUF4434 domain-containing protein [Bacteroidales bacterium]
MKKFLYFFSTIVLISINSYSQSDNKEFKAEELQVPFSKKTFAGSFIDFFRKNDWSQQGWESQFQEMKDIGMNTAIIQFISYGDITWFNSANNFTKKKYPDALPILLAAANNKQMDVFIGLYFDEEYWKNQTNVDWLLLHADRCISIAEELNAQFGKYPAFKGWYIPHEPEPNAYHSKELTTSLKDNFINRISDKLHSFDSKPVSIAAFFNSELTSTTQLKDFMTELCKSNLQIIMLQDGIGVNHVSLDQVGLYYSEAARGLYENTNYKGEFWTDLETFSFAPQGPVTIDRIKKQLQEELSVSHVTKAVTFQYYHDMCPTGPGGTAAARLRNDYLNFIKDLGLNNKIQR